VQKGATSVVERPPRNGEKPAKRMSMKERARMAARTMLTIAPGDCQPTVRGGGRYGGVG
jgi:hypothetical protein